jgi:hypothetical protein
MKLILALTVLLSLLFTASAATENYTNGPYEFSFNMNTSLNHTVEIQKTIETNTSIAYPLLVKTSNNESAMIVLAENKNLADSTPQTEEIIAVREFALRGFNHNNSMKISPNMTIDGKEGFAIMGNNSKDTRVIKAFYWLDSKKCECGPVSVGKTEVALESTYPANITYWLISSLHAEKNMNASTKKPPLTFKPPS